MFYTGSAAGFLLAPQACLGVRVMLSRGVMVHIIHYTVIYFKHSFFETLWLWLELNESQESEWSHRPKPIRKLKQKFMPWPVGSLVRLLKVLQQTVIDTPPRRQATKCDTQRIKKHWLVPCKEYMLRKRCKRNSKKHRFEKIVKQSSFKSDWSRNQEFQEQTHKDLAR